YNEVSRLIKEIPTTLVNLEKNTQLESIHSLGIEETKRIYISKLTPTIKEKIVNKDKSTYNIGDRVGHRKFGSGIITAITVDSITINFDNLGDKILLKEYANLSKE
ncbi:hypothetical protein IR145_15360, partial [Streptococcus danieliae]|nr:hypothetical protein [Streptococcus danieliae]